MEVCKFFLQSRCTKGASCPFRHDVTDPTCQQSSAPATLATRRVEKGPCRFFRIANCRWGDSCAYSHVLPPAETEEHIPLEEQQAQLDDSRSGIPCRFESFGGCTKGTQCPYLHAREQSNVLNDDAVLGEDTIDADDFRRFTYGAFVEFGDGGAVSKLSSPLDFSAVRLEGLPPKSTALSIGTILAKNNFHVQSQDVLVLPNPSQDPVSVRITSNNPRFAENICSIVQAGRLGELPGTDLNAAVIQARLPTSATARHTNSRKVLVSWNRSTRLVWLNFGKQEIAERVREKFNRGQYQICGSTVSADPAKSSGSGVWARGRGHHHNPVAWTLLLRNVPASAKQHDVERAISAQYDQPRHIEMGKQPHQYSQEDVPSLVESLFTQIGPVVFTLRPDQTHDFLGGQKLMLQLMSSTKLKVSFAIFEAVQDRIYAHTELWREQHVSLKVFPDASTGRRFVVLKVEGQEAKLVAKATAMVESTLAGKTVTNGSVPLWVPSLMTNGASFRRLQNVQSVNEVYLVRNRRKRLIQYFGPDERYERVQNALIEQLKDATSATHVIELLGEDFRWACRGGFNAIREAFGEDKVSFDIVSTPKRIIVVGTEDIHHEARRILQTKQVATPSQAILAPSSDCSICWTPAEDAVVLTCHHVYCSDCFEGLCLSADSSHADFLITCQGDEGVCAHPISLTDLSTHLSSSALETAFEASIKSHINRRPTDLRYCPSPDCGFVYRPSRGRQTCTGCLELICTDCHDQHASMTCAEFKKSMKIKDCPKCKTPIEKASGCNHMTCAGCGAHICWVCLKLFEDPRLFYDHMTAEHGSFGL